MTVAVAVPVDVAAVPVGKAAGHEETACAAAAAEHNRVFLEEDGEAAQTAAWGETHTVAAGEETHTAAAEGEVHTVVAVAAVNALFVFSVRI